uniref:Flightin n=1 Tax=Glossina brevipalpis TaxID=37001 RepID=A0A1A9W7K1_9MUSC
MSMLRDICNLSNHYPWYRSNMADEEDPWGFDDETTTEPEPAKPDDSAQAAGETKAADGEKGAEGTAGGESEAALPPPPPEDDGYRKPVQLYKHWVRPKFLQYKYMYNYRTNYYDDVIDYLNKKQVGVSREIPRAQTWAERVLRTSYSRNLSVIDCRAEDDIPSAATKKRR